MKKILGLVLLLYTACAGADNTSERINGVAEFLLDRANDNYLYLFQNSIAKNEKFKCYFPTTHSSLTQGGTDALKRLMTSKETWRESIQRDLQILTIRSLADEIVLNPRFRDFALAIDELAEKSSEQAIVIQQLQIRYKDDVYPLNQIPISASDELRDLINGFYLPFADASSVLKKLEQYGADCDAPGSSAAPGRAAYEGFDYQDFKNTFDRFHRYADDIQAWSVHVKENIKNLELVPIVDPDACSLIGLDRALCSDRDAFIESTEDRINLVLQENINRVFSEKTKAKLSEIKRRTDALSTTSGDLYERLVIGAYCRAIGIEEKNCNEKSISESAERAVTHEYLDDILKSDLLANLKELQEIREVLEEAELSTIKKVEIALKDIRELEVERNGELEKILSEKEFERLSRHVRFFAEVADADTAEDVKSVLTNYTLPSVSFFEKRRGGEHFMITSYLGLTANIDEDDDVDDANDGIFAPIGLEYSYGGLGWGWFDSISVMASPFDFGYPVNLKLSGTEDKFEFDEVIAPSLTFALGVRDYPLMLGLGYQRGREIEETGQTEDRVLLFVTFDMPLFNLYND